MQGKDNPKYGQVTRAQFERLEYQALRKRTREKLAGWILIFSMITIGAFLAGVYFARSVDIESFTAPEPKQHGKRK